MRADDGDDPVIVRLIVFLASIVARIAVAIFALAYRVFWMDEFRPAFGVEAEVLEPWRPLTSDERAVAAALILAGGRGTNGMLAELMGVSPAEASKRVTALGDIVRKKREGRTVQISIPQLLN